MTLPPRNTWIAPAGPATGPPRKKPAAVLKHKTPAAKTVSALLLSVFWLLFGVHLSPAQFGSNSELSEHIRAGLKARDEDRLEDAAREFEAAVTIAPQVAEIHASLGLVRHRQGNLSAAADSFRRALELKPEINGVHGLLGFDLLMLGRAQEALEHLQKGLEEEPKSRELNSWLGLAYFQSGEYRKAIEVWESVRESGPPDVDLLLYLARAYEAVFGELRDEIFRLDPDRAKAEFETAGEDAPTASDSSSGRLPPSRFEHREPLIRQSCTQCHRWTPPAILPKKAWFGKIAKMFGLANEGMLASLGKPIKDVEMEEVVAYFQTLAPEELSAPPWGPAKPREGLRFDRRSLQGVPPGDRLPGTGNVRLLELFDDIPGPELVVSDMLSGWVSWTGPNDPEMELQPLARLTHPVHAEAVDLDGDGRMDLLVADLGEVMPSDKQEGSVVWLRRTGKRQFETVRLAEKLGRVADVQAADFDGDGDLDLVVAEFGWITVGRIVYFENRPESPGGPPSFHEVVLDDRTGAIHVPVADLDNDGKPDFVALISQQHETVVAFLNRGEGRFEKREIFTAPHPHWGSSGIELVDVDGDGDLDVVLTNGDTMDDQVRYKPYQGVSWLENRGTYPFVHHAIGGYYGAMRAQAGDLDGDGDLDLVAVSWLPELKETERKGMTLPGVIWYEQVSPGSFEARVFSDAPCDYTTLDLGDIDGDGRLDVVAGAAWLGTPPTDRPPVAVEIWRQR